MIGFGMMSSSAILDSLPPTSTPGVKLIGNYGSGRHLIFVDSDRPPTSPKRKHGSVFATPSSLKVLAGPFRLVSNAPGASLSMCVINAVPNNPEANVPRGQLKPALAVSVLREKEALLKCRALHSQPVTPVKADRLECFLEQGYDSVLSHYLIDGFRFGFRIHFVGERRAYESCNLKSALSQPDITKMKLRKECDAGRIVGPFTTRPFSNFRTFLVGLVPKKYTICLIQTDPP